MVYLPRYDFDLDTFQINSSDMCSTPISIMQNTTSAYHHQNPKDIDDYLNVNRISFTEFLSSDNNMMDQYGSLIHATTCSTPESDNYSIYLDDPKIKMEYPEPPLDSIYEMTRT